MSANLFLIFNHRFTAAQEADAFRSLDVTRVLPPPPEIAFLWSHIPPDLAGIRDYLKPVRDWLAASASPGDYVLIQGDFGACCILVSFAAERGLIPIYSTTHREMIEEVLLDGTIRLIHHFDHRIFRKYGA